MNTQTLEYIIAIAEEKSISRAADRLLVSQPRDQPTAQARRGAPRHKALSARAGRDDSHRCRQNLCERGAIRPKYLRART